MDNNRLAKITKNRKPDISRPLGRSPKVGAKIGHQHHRRIGILDKIQDMVLEEEKDEQEELSSKDIPLVMPREKAAKKLAKQLADNLADNMAVPLIPFRAISPS